MLRAYWYRYEGKADVTDCLLDDSTIASLFLEICDDDYKRILILSLSIFSLDLSRGKFFSQAAVSTNWKNQSRCAKRLVLQKATVGLAREQQKTI